MVCRNNENDEILDIINFCALRDIKTYIHIYLYILLITWLLQWYGNNNKKNPTDTVERCITRHAGRCLRTRHNYINETCNSRTYSIRNKSIRVLIVLPRESVRAARRYRRKLRGDGVSFSRAYGRRYNCFQRMTQFLVRTNVTPNGRVYPYFHSAAEGESGVI